MNVKNRFQASGRDSTCATCYWGLAFVLGPNIDSTMGPADMPEAYSASRRALQLAEGVTEREGAFIEALATRYGPEEAREVAVWFDEAWRYADVTIPGSRF